MARPTIEEKYLNNDCLVLSGENCSLYGGLVGCCVEIHQHDKLGRMMKIDFGDSEMWFYQNEVTPL